eukprot:gene12182-15304_t
MSSDASAPEVLWAGRFRLEKAGDEVEEIKLDVPARITQVLISDVGGQSKAPPVLKVFARDLYSVSGARFAPLCSSTISCAEQSTSTYRTEPITTNHVIIRGRYSNLAFSLLGYLDHDKSCAEQSFSEDLLPLEGERLFKTTLVPIGRTSTLDYSQVHSPVSPLALKTSPGSSKQIPGALPLPALPSAFARVLHNALLYYGEVRRSHKLILTNRPGQLLKPLQEIADAVCESLKAISPLVRLGIRHPLIYPRAAEDPSLPIPDWNDYIVGMAVSWCNLLASPSSFLPSDMAVGMAGLHASLVLCTTAPGCAAFIAGGGIEALVELLMVPNIPSDMARYCIALCELAVVSGTNTGCERQLSAGDVKPEREGGPSPKLEERVKEEEADGHGEGGEGDEGDQEYNTYSVDEYESGGGEQEEGAEEEKGEEDEEMREDEHKEGGEAQGEDVDEHEEQDEGMRITDPDHPLYEYDEPDYSNDPGVGEEMIQEIDDAGGNEEDEKVMYDNGVDEGNDEGNEGDDTRNRLDNISEADKEAKQASVRSGSHACAQRDGSPAERGGDGREAGGERRQGGHPKPNPDDMEAKKDSKDGSQRHRDTDREAGPRQRDAHREKTRKRIRSVSKSHSPSRSPSRSRSRSRSPSRSRSRSHSRSRGQPSSRSPSRSRRKAHSSHSRHRSRQRSRSRERRRSSGRKHSHSRRSGSPSPAGSRSRSRSRSGRAEKVKRVESGTQSRDERGVKREVREHSAPARSAYGSLLQLCTLRRRPDVAAAARRTLQCLQAYEVLCRFQRNVNKVVFSRGGPKQEEQKQLSAQEELLCVREACMALSELPGLCIAPTADEQELQKAEDIDEQELQKAEDIGKGLPPSTEADTTVLQLMHSCSLFGSIATLSHASASLASQLKAAAAKGGGSPTAPGPGGRPSMTPARQAHLQLQQLPIFHAQMVGTTRTLMSLLMSTTPGLRIISASQKQVAALMHALDPSREDAQGSELGTASAFGLSDASGILQDGGGAAAALAAEKRLATLNEQHLLVSSMREVLVAQAAVHDLETRTMGDPAAAAAVLSLVAAVSAPPPSPACTAALILTQQAQILALFSLVHTLNSLETMFMPRAVLLEAAGLPVGGLSRRQASNSALDEDEDDLEGGMLWEDLKQVVLELVKQCHPDLIAGWVGMADAILEAARSELEALSSTRNGLASSFGGTAPHDGQYGDDRSKRALREMIGRVEAVVLFQDQGLHGVLSHLDHVLVPQLMSKDTVVDQGLHGVLTHLDHVLVPQLMSKDIVDQGLHGVLTHLDQVFVPQLMSKDIVDQGLHGVLTHLDHVLVPQLMSKDIVDQGLHGVLTHLDHVLVPQLMSKDIVDQGLHGVLTHLDQVFVPQLMSKDIVDQGLHGVLTHLDHVLVPQLMSKDIVDQGLHGVLTHLDHVLVPQLMSKDIVDQGLHGVLTHLDQVFVPQLMSKDIVDQGLHGVLTHLDHVLVPQLMSKDIVDQGLHGVLTHLDHVLVPQLMSKDIVDQGLHGVLTHQDNVFVPQLMSKDIVDQGLHGVLTHLDHVLVPQLTSKDIVDQGLHGVLTHLDHVLVPQLMSKDIVVGGVTKKGLKKEVENRATMTLLKAPERCGKLSMLLRLMALKVGGGEDKQLSMMAFRNSALQVLERALRTGTHALLTSIADGQWAYLRGDAISELDRLRNHQQGSAILAAACHATLSMLVGLSKAGTQKLCNSGMPEAMIRAHAQLCLEKDSLATALGASRTSGDLLQARQALSAALGVWVDAGWGPNAISLLFSVRPSTGVDLDLTRGDENSVDGKAASSVAAANIDAAATNQSPSQIYTTSCLLGDLLPPEWPQPQRQPQGGAAPKHVLGPPAPPECPARRAALASAMELCQTPLRRLLHFGASSESRVIRCSLVRLMSRAAGLSASMGMFMSQPLIEHLQAIRVLGLCQTAVVLSEEGTDGVASCTMALEALTILCNPDVALNIGLPLEDRLQNDTPSVTEASTLVAALLACLPNLASEFCMCLLLPSMW